MTSDSTDLRLPECILLEGVVTTLNEVGSLHIAPMGPIVNADFTQLLLRPFISSTTYKNLTRTSEGVFHITDDVDLVARSAVSKLEEHPSLLPAKTVKGQILAGACRWYEFRVASANTQNERAEFVCNVVHHGQLRDFIGFNRAKHAVLEAAILATRIGILEPTFIHSEFDRLRVIVDKTGSSQEHTAFEFLRGYLASRDLNSKCAEMGG